MKEKINFYKKLYINKEQNIKKFLKKVFYIFKKNKI